jgi:hypothetical protein
MAATGGTRAPAAGGSLQQDKPSSALLASTDGAQGAALVAARECMDALSTAITEALQLVGSWQELRHAAPGAAATAAAAQQLEAGQEELRRQVEQLRAEHAAELQRVQGAVGRSQAEAEVGLQAAGAKLTAVSEQNALLQAANQELKVGARSC